MHYVLVRSRGPRTTRQPASLWAVMLPQLTCLLLRGVVQEGMVMTQWHETGRTVEFFEPKTETYYMIDKRDFIQRYFSNAFRYEHRWVNVAILLSMIVASRVGFYLCLKYKVK